MRAAWRSAANRDWDEAATLRVLLCVVCCLVQQACQYVMYVMTLATNGMLQIPALQREYDENRNGRCLIKHEAGETRTVE